MVVEMREKIFVMVSEGFVFCLYICIKMFLIVIRNFFDDNDM